MRCKYKIRLKDFNDNEPYCGILEKTCHRLPTLCDHNCQVYEDFKLLKQLEAENKRIKEAINRILTGSTPDYDYGEINSILRKALEGNG